MKQAAANDPSRENRAAAHASDKHASTAKSFPAATGVIQAMLDLGQTYKAKQVVTAYDATNALNRTDIATNTLVTAIEYDLPSVLTEVYDRPDAARKFTPMIFDDSANFGAVGPKLADDHVNRIKANPEHFEFTDYSNNGLRKSQFDINEISQGEMGDCWLLAAMAAMTTSPQWRTFLQASIKVNGTNDGFDVRLFDRMDPGEVEQIVSISGLLLQLDPSSGFDRQLVYAQQRSIVPRDSSSGGRKFDPIWPALMEKAAAQLYGGYEPLDDLETSEGFKLLTGKTAALLQPKTTTLKSGDWLTLRQQFALGAAMTATTAKNLNMAMGRKMADDPSTISMAAANIKLLENHAYIVTGFTSGGKMELFNPHGDPHPAAQTRTAVNECFARVEVLPAP